MPRKPRTPAGVDAAILRYLLDGRDLWAVTVLERRIGNRAAVEASIARLRRKGLIYEASYGFVGATKAARQPTARRQPLRRWVLRGRFVSRYSEIRGSGPATAEDREGT